MYVPKHFSEQDANTLFRLISDYSFGTLITCADHRPAITHLPFIVDSNQGQQGVLLGHFAKANSHWRTIGVDTRGTAVFLGPHSYISPNWYEDRAQVPTWNYTAVHVMGPVQLVTEADQVLDIVTRLTEFNESTQSAPWQVDNARPNLEKMLNAIVGFRIPIEDIQGKYKLSQNRTRADQAGVVQALREDDDPLRATVASLMQHRLNGVD